MPTYTTDEKVEAILPTLPAAITAADQARWIADGSTMVDSEVGARFPILGTGQKFADITDSPPTPGEIELCARWYAAYFGFLNLRIVNRTGRSEGRADLFFKLASERLALIRKGEVEIFDENGNELASINAAYSTTEDVDRVFTRTVRKDGEIQGDAGTLHDFSINP